MSAPPRLKLRAIWIDGFKALNNFYMEVPDDLLLLIGPNGAGKSTVLQALAFIKYFSKAKVHDFFDDQGTPAVFWGSEFSKRNEKWASGAKDGVIVRFCLVFSLGRDVIAWRFEVDVFSGQNIFEECILDDGDEVRSVFQFAFSESQNFNEVLLPDATKMSRIRLPGSALAIIQMDDSNNLFRLLGAIRSWSGGILSLTMLNPAKMRSASEESTHDIGLYGERLSGFLASLSQDSRQKVLSRLKFALAPIADIQIVKRLEWYFMLVKDSYSDAIMEAFQASDGMLRLVALACIPEFSAATSIVVLDEIEDGIDSHALPGIVELISRESGAQIIATSHSPILVNIFSPENVCFIGRCESGPAVAMGLNEIPQVTEELEHRGPGEIWAQTSLGAIGGWVREAAANKAASLPGWDDPGFVKSLMDRVS